MVNANLLKSAIVRSGLTQEALAKRINETNGTMSRKVNNIATFTLGEAQAIARELGLTEQEINDIFFSKELADK